MFGPAGSIPRVSALAHPQLVVTMKEIDQAVLPQGRKDTCGMGVTFGKTRVWAYESSDAITKKVRSALARSVDRRSILFRCSFVSQLPSFNCPTYGPGSFRGYACRSDIALVTC